MFAPDSHRWGGVSPPRVRGRRYCTPHYRWPETRGALQGSPSRWSLAVTLAWIGEKDALCAELRRFCAEACVVNVPELRAALWFAPLRDYPVFQALLDDPKHHATVF